MFPLPGALLLPRGQMPLNIFEPRYLAMIDDALRDGHRLIGMIQPDAAHPGPEDKPHAVTRSAASAASPSSPRPATAAICIQLTGVARFRIEEELDGRDRLSAMPRHLRAVRRRFHRAQGRGRGRPQGGARARCAHFLKANNLKADWEGIENAPNEALVNALAMMSPYGAAEKQALLEAPDLKTRAEILVAVTEIELAKKQHRAARRRCSRPRVAPIRYKADELRRGAHAMSTTIPPPTVPPAASIRSCWKSWSAR